MAVLQSKLLERRRQEEQAKINALKGDNSGSWGNQMRSYVLHPYQMVKDLRTDMKLEIPAQCLMVKLMNLSKLEFVGAEVGNAAISAPIEQITAIIRVKEGQVLSLSHDFSIN